MTSIFAGAPSDREEVPKPKPKPRLSLSQGRGEIGIGSSSTRVPLSEELLNIIRERAKDRSGPGQSQPHPEPPPEPHPQSEEQQPEEIDLSGKFVPKYGCAEKRTDAREFCTFLRIRTSVQNILQRVHNVNCTVVYLLSIPITYISTFKLWCAFQSMNTWSLNILLGRRGERSLQELPQKRR